MTRASKGLVLACLMAAACGDRAPIWDEPVAGDVPIFGLERAVALVDAPAHRVVLLGPELGGALTRTVVGTGLNVVNVAPSADGARLFVLSAGQRRRLGDPADTPVEAPSLTIVNASASGGLGATTVDLGGVLSEPLTGMAVDPQGQWLVLFAGGRGTGAFVENPNELVLIDVSGPTPTPAQHTLQSFGGRPVRMTFTPELHVGAATLRLLVVESEQDISLVRLAPGLPEISVRLTSGTTTRRLVPAGIVVQDGDGAAAPLIGVRLENDPEVVTLQLDPSSSAAGVAPAPNITDVGAVPSDLAFVRTEAGVRLAALVPDLQKAVLIDPATSLTTQVDLPTSYTRVSLVTEDAGAGPGVDVALLWAARGSTGGVAFWELGQTAGRPYRAVETIGLTAAVEAVLDVPAPNQRLKVLKTRGSTAFYVLDLQSRTAAPLVTATPQISLAVARGGERVWAYTPGGSPLAVTALATKDVRTLDVGRPVSAVHEVRRGDGGVSAVVIHAVGGIGATVYDANQPSDETRRLHSGLLIGGPYDDR